MFVYPLFEVGILKGNCRNVDFKTPVCRPNAHPVIMSSRAPKQWPLTKTETLNSFTNWKENLIYILSLDPNFSPFLTDENVSWKKKSTADPARGFTDDPVTVPEPQRRRATQKCASLELMLGQMANYATVISRN